MEREQIIADYKKARHIRDEYVLDEDEMYFVDPPESMTMFALM